MAKGEFIAKWVSTCGYCKREVQVGQKACFLTKRSKVIAHARCKKQMALPSGWSSPNWGGLKPEEQQEGEAA